MEHSNISRIRLTCKQQTQINYSRQLSPHWVNQHTLQYISAFNFSIYDIETDEVRTILRQEDQGTVECILWHLGQTATTMDEQSVAAIYITRKMDSFYLRNTQQKYSNNILLFRNQHIVNHTNCIQQPIISKSGSIIKKRQQTTIENKMISNVFQNNYKPNYKIHMRNSRKEDTHKLQLEQQLLKKTDDRPVVFIMQKLLKLCQLVQLQEFVYMVVIDISSQSGLLLVNWNRCFKQKQYSCKLIDIGQGIIDSTDECRVLFMFPTTIKQVRKIGECLLILTQKDISCYSVDLSAIGLKEQDRYVFVCSLYGLQIEYTEIDHKVYLIVMVEQNSQQLSENTKMTKDNQYGTTQHPSSRKRYLELFTLVGRKIIPLASSFVNIQSLPSQKHHQFHQKYIPNQSQFYSQIIPSPKHHKQQSSQPTILSKIYGFTIKKNTLLTWQSSSSTIHQFTLIPPKHRIDPIANPPPFCKLTSSVVPTTDIHCQPTVTPITTYLQHSPSIDLDLNDTTIQGISFSPKGSNLLLLSQSNSALYHHCQFHTFSYDISTTLHTDAKLCLKNVNNMFIAEPVTQIAHAKVSDAVIILSGSQLHTMTNYFLDGVQSFAIHPYNIFLSAAFSYIVKIYSRCYNILQPLHTINIPYVKQIVYNPNGSELCLMTNKTLFIIDTYNFGLKVSVNQKGSQFVNVVYSDDGLWLIVICRNNCLVYSTYDYKKYGEIKLDTSLSSNCFIIQLKLDSINNCCCIVIDTGELCIHQHTKHFQSKQTIIYRYKDTEHIMTILIDHNNCLIFIGCKSGKLRVHNWPLTINNFNQYTQIRNGYSPITVISLAKIQSNIYVGNNDGNVSLYSYSVNNNPLEDNIKINQKIISLRHSKEQQYRYCLTNTLVASKQDPEKVKLQAKTEEVIQKLEDKVTELRKLVNERFVGKHRNGTRIVEDSMLSINHGRSNLELKMQIETITQQHEQNILRINQQHQKAENIILKQQDKLIASKSDLINYQTYTYTNLLTKLKLQQQQLQTQQQKQLKTIIDKYSDQQFTDGYNSQTINSQQPFEDTLFQLQSKLQVQYELNLELNKTYTEKSTKMSTMVEKRGKEQTLEFKIIREINEMKCKLERQKDKIVQLSGKIEQAENTIQSKDKNKVIRGNANFEKISKNTRTDACAYKLYMKDNCEHEVEHLQSYLQQLNQCFDQRNEDITTLLQQKNHMIEIISKLQDRIIQDKKKYSEKKLKLMCVKRRVDKIKSNLINWRVDEEKVDMQRIMELPQSTSLNNSRVVSRSRANKIREARQTVREWNQTSRSGNGQTSLPSQRSDLKLMDSLHTKLKLVLNHSKNKKRAYKIKLGKYRKQNSTILAEYKQLRIENHELGKNEQSLLTELSNKCGLELAKVGKYKEKSTEAFQRVFLQKYSRLSSKFNTTNCSPMHKN